MQRAVDRLRTHAPRGGVEVGTADDAGAFARFGERPFSEPPGETGAPEHVQGEYRPADEVVPGRGQSRPEPEQRLRLPRGSLGDGGRGGDLPSGRRRIARARRGGGAGSISPQAIRPSPAFPGGDVPRRRGVTFQGRSLLVPARSRARARSAEQGRGPTPAWLPPTGAARANPPRSTSRAGRRGWGRWPPGLGAGERQGPAARESDLRRPDGYPIPGTDGRPALCGCPLPSPPAH